MPPHDPWQMTNEADNPDYAATIADCEQRLERLVMNIEFDPENYPECHYHTIRCTRNEWCYNYDS